MASAKNAIPASARRISHSLEVHHAARASLSASAPGSGSRRMRDGRATGRSSTLFLPGFEPLITRPHLRREAYFRVTPGPTLFALARVDTLQPRRHMARLPASLERWPSG